ncbi:MAG: hypothetical protein A3F11_08965 [Gammaproteobacteria bacterium RIFCSPHIGHO2_12_FULL_37_14]|nr:MAG: hypothetical protein A3F11_08965 [Gammaproteobacteria bacterium RIFCSPHIGHO2_12_FULL_37_14]
MSFSISEVIVVLLVALLVIKPEQLPDVAFTLGRLAQSARRMLVKVKQEVNSFIEPIEKSDERK